MRDISLFFYNVYKGRLLRLTCNSSLSNQINFNHLNKYMVVKDKRFLQNSHILIFFLVEGRVFLKYIWNECPLRIQSNLTLDSLIHSHTDVPLFCGKRLTNWRTAMQKYRPGTRDFREKIDWWESWRLLAPGIFQCTQF